MGLRRLATFRNPTSTLGREVGVAVLFDFGGGPTRIVKVDLEREVNPVRALQTVVAARADQTAYVHRNRDGSYAVAVGTEPRVWPEDERYE